LWKEDILNTRLFSFLDITVHSVFLRRLRGEGGFLVWDSMVDTGSIAENRHFIP